MSYKQRTLDAQLALIKRYKHNKPPRCCPFCQIYKNSGYRECNGCFMADDYGQPACLRFASSVNSMGMDEVSEDRRLKRAEFHRKVRKILLKKDPKYFTPSGWEPFNISDNW